HRADGPGAPFLAIDPGGDVLAVPHGLYLDTTGDVADATAYAVSTVASVELPAADLSPAAVPGPLPAVWLGRVAIRIDARADAGPVGRPWRACIGSEHLALLLDGPGPGGLPVGDDLAEAFRIVHDELGVRLVRAHAILHDRLGLYREVDGEPVFDFARTDAVFDRLLATGLEPLIELSFMPRDLASDPIRTTFAYRGIISPPRDHDRWGALVEGFVRHLVKRYGRAAVAGWPFEIWNEPNLQLFWAGTESDYFELYDAAARAVKAVDPGFLVGGPATSAVGWVDDLLEYAAVTGAPLDFVSTHTYGHAPLDLRPVLGRHGRPDLPVYWTEWGAHGRLGSDVNDGPWGAPLAARGMRSAAGRVESLSYWVASDQFVELGVPDRLFNGGFGLLTIGNLRKPQYWALWMLEQLGEREVACTLEGDGAGSLVEAWASRSGERLGIVAWNGTPDRARTEGDAALGRDTELEVHGLEPGSYLVRHRRVDAAHSNIHALWQEFGDDNWPDDFGWERLRERDRLEDLEPPASVAVGTEGLLRLTFALPMPAVSLIEIERTAHPLH
ncbi:MAG TPA: xylan 1,4-beta-xylosidase, partial [Clostridia bacterium]|nr:xylan 1,4-beta-xylosidase [Clostridia bacterium]